MAKSLATLTGFLCLFLACPAYAQEGGSFLSLQRRISEIYNDNSSAIVRVKAATREQLDVEQPQVSLYLGTGFFISREGHVLTTARVAFNADRLWIIHRGVEYAAEVVGLDLEPNVALLRVLNLPEDFRFLHLTDLVNLPSVGTMVVRLSSPLEFDPTPQFGLVAGKESEFFQRVFPCTYIRSTMPGGSGEDGSPLIDLDGRLIGMQIGVLPDNLGTYVLPSRAALRLRDDLLFSGEVIYGWIGFEVQEVSSRKDGSQVALSKIIADTPAHEAGLRTGDILLTIGDQAIHRISDVRNGIFYSRVGQFVSVQVKRNNETLDFNIRIVARPAAKVLDDSSVGAEPVETETTLSPTIEQESIKLKENSAIDSEKDNLPLTLDQLILQSNLDQYDRGF